MLFSHVLIKTVLITLQLLFSLRMFQQVLSSPDLWKILLAKYRLLAC